MSGQDLIPTPGLECAMCGQPSVGVIPAVVVAHTGGRVCPIGTAIPAVEALADAITNPRKIGVPRVGQRRARRGPVVVPAVAAS